MAEITAMTRLGEHRAAQKRIAEAAAAQSKLQDEITNGLTATRSVTGHLAGITALKKGEELLAILAEQESLAAARLAEALSELHRAHADEHLMKQLHDRQLKQHRDEMLRREEHGLLETALALRHSTIASCPVEQPGHVDVGFQRPAGHRALGSTEEGRTP